VVIYPGCFESNVVLPLRGLLGNTVLTNSGNPWTSLWQVAGPLGSSAAEHETHDLGARVYDIRSFGAKGDGKALDTTALHNRVNTNNDGFQFVSVKYARVSNFSALSHSERHTPAPFEFDGLCAAAFDNQLASLTRR